MVREDWLCPGAGQRGLLASCMGRGGLLAGWVTRKTCSPQAAAAQLLFACSMSCSYPAEAGRQGKETAGKS